MLEREGLRQINQRITARFHLRPLSLSETGDYIRHRVAVAGVDRPLFTAGAVRRIHRVSGGVPRVINILCDRALLGACVTRANQVTPGIVARAAREVQGERLDGKDSPAVRPAFAAAASVTLLLVAGWLSYGWHMGDSVARTRLAGLWDRVLPQTEPAPKPAVLPAEPLAASPASPRVSGGATSEAVPGPAAEPRVLPGPPSDPGGALDALTDVDAVAPGAMGEAVGVDPAPEVVVPAPEVLVPEGPAVAGPEAQPVPEPAAIPAPSVPETAEAALPRVSLASFAPDAAGETLARLAMPEETALRVLLRRWGVRIKDLGGGDACARVAALGLRCERERGKLSNVRYFDRPVLLRVGDRSGERRYAALGSLDQDYATLDLETGAELVPVAGLESVWTGDYTVLWRPPPTGAPLIGPGASTDSIQWLRRLIAQVPDSGLAYVDSGRFDATLTGALMEFQRSRGLAADGLAGPRTLIQLNNAAGTPGIPRLMPGAELAAANEGDALARLPASTDARDAP